MKDENDNNTAELLVSTGAKRQADYAARQRAQGRKQRSFWLNDAEAAQVAELLERLRPEAESGNKKPAAKYEDEEK